MGLGSTGVLRYGELHWPTSWLLSASDLAVVPELEDHAVARPPRRIPEQHCRANRTGVPSNLSTPASLTRNPQLAGAGGQQDPRLHCLFELSRWITRVPTVEGYNTLTLSREICGGPLAQNNRKRNQCRSSCRFLPFPSFPEGPTCSLTFLWAPAGKGSREWEKMWRCAVPRPALNCVWVCWLRRRSCQGVKTYNLQSFETTWRARISMNVPHLYPTSPHPISSTTRGWWVVDGESWGALHQIDQMGTFRPVPFKLKPARTNEMVPDSTCGRAGPNQAVRQRAQSIGTSSRAQASGSISIMCEFSDARNGWRITKSVALEPLLCLPSAIAVQAC
jgi:hypothetical protein